MKRFFQQLFLLILVLVPAVALAQLSDISGNILSRKTAIEGATIVLYKLTDTTKTKSTVSGAHGSFSLSNVPAGSYFIGITSVGYKTLRSNPIHIDSNKGGIHDLKFELEAAQKTLQQVTVQSKRPFVEQKPGKTILNVEASPSNAGMNALELLEKSPGVSVDKDGNISIRGKEGVMVLIDGRQTYLSGADLTAMLKTIQSNNLDQIEIMTNPPAKYDAAGNSGIINIKTKKLIVRGMNGNASTAYTQGLYGRANGNISLNYRNNKVNLFGSYGANKFEGFNSIKLTRKFYNADKTLGGSSDQSTRPKFISYNQNFKAGADWYFSKKDILGIVVNGNFSNGTENPTSTSNIRDANGNIIYSLKSFSSNNSTFSNASSNINYKHTFDSLGREVTVDADYVYYNKENNTLMNTQTFAQNGNSNGEAILLKGYIPSQINIYSIKSDYVHPLNKTSKIEAGIKSSFVNTDNMVDYLRSTTTGWNKDDRSNHFLYKENINAAYAIYNQTFKKLQLTVGLRAENTIANGRQAKNDSTFKRNYTNLFPNVGFGYEANDKNQYNVSFSRRVDRPSYNDLNPFIFFLDSLTYGQGNPYLQPQFTNNFEVSHTYKRTLTTTLNYSHTNNVITEILKQDTEKKTTFQTRDNVNQLRQIGLTIMFNKPLTKWWNANVFVNVFNKHYTGMYQSDPIDISFTTAMANVTNNFTLPKGWSTELSGFYRSKGAEGLLIAKGMGGVNAGISKQMLKKKGSIKVSIRDIFFTQKFSGYARYSDVDVHVKSQRDSRQVTASFTYRFGKNNIAPARRRTGGAGDEQNRVGGN